MIAILALFGNHVKHGYRLTSLTRLNRHLSPSPRDRRRLASSRSNDLREIIIKLCRHLNGGAAR